MTDLAPPTVTLSLPRLAAKLLHTARAGTLSTLSTHLSGWPFGSLTPFAIARDGSLILVLSDLAEHTRNLRADARASLFIQDPASETDPQAQARITILGRVAALDDGPSRANARARYIARFPEADGYLTQLDFRIYALAVEQVRLIGGFGRMAWMDRSSIVEDPSSDPLADAANDICQHMNQDHGVVLGLYCEAFRGKKVASATMTSVDTWGFDVTDGASGEQFRFDFSEALSTPDAVRKAVVAMAREARAKLAPST